MRYFMKGSMMALALVLVAPTAAAAQEAAAPPRAATLWEALGDTTLARLVDEARRANHDVEAAGARVSGARAARLGAMLELTPSVTAVSGYSRQRLASATFPGADGRLPEQSLWDAGLQASWEVDVFGRLRSSLRARDELVSAADEGRRDTELLVSAQVAEAYFALRTAQERLAVARRNAENQRGTLELTRQRLEGGRGTALDTELAQAQLSATLAVIPTLEADVAAAEHRIAVLTGRAPGPAVAELAEGAPPVTLPDVPELAAPQQVVLDRPDVQGAERELAASSAFVGAARADYLPRLSLGATAGYTGSTFDALGDRNTPRYAFGPIITWPALDLGRVRAGVDQARAEESAARARYEQAVLRAREEVETSLVTYRKARERLRLLEEAAAASERAAELARLRYTEGASDFLQVLDAERTLLERQDAAALGRLEAAAGLVAVYRALGGGRVFMPGEG